MSDAPGYPAARHEFLLRRLHSLAGLVPIGAFVVFHLLTNAGIVLDKKGDFYQQQVNLIHSLGPLLVPVEFIFIFIPLAFHAGLGVKMWLQGSPNTSHYLYWGNTRYMLQRITGVVALLFIGVHLWQMHWMANLLPGGGLFDAEQAPGTAAWILQHYAAWAGPVYLVGILCAVFHLANGVWTSLITWGITIGPAAQRKAGYVCAVLGIALALAGTSSLWGFMRFGKPIVPKKVQKHEEQSRVGQDGGAENLRDSPPPLRGGIEKDDPFPRVALVRQGGLASPVATTRRPFGANTAGSFEASAAWPAGLTGAVGGDSGEWIGGPRYVQDPSLCARG